MSDGPIIKINGQEGWKGNPINPGDVFEIGVGEYTLRIKNLVGERDKPITFTNKGKISTTLAENPFVDCQWIIIDGSGMWSEEDKQIYMSQMARGDISGIPFGFQFRGKIRFWNKSLGLVVRFCHFVGYDASGVHAHAGEFPAWEMTDILVEYNYFEAISEMTYVGDWEGNNAEYQMERIEICYNVAHACMGGYQLRGAKTPQDGLIHHNWAFDCINGPNEWGHIDVGANCAARVFNNWLEGGTGFLMNISYQCRKDVEVFNNVVVFGKAYENRKSAFRQGSDDGGTIRIYNNTIVGGEAFGLDVTSKHSQTVAFNNIIVGAAKAIDMGSSPSENFHHNLTEEAGFVGEKDFHLLSTSPAIGAATLEGIPEEDFDGNIRKSADIGAFEFITIDIPPEPEPDPTLPDDSLTAIRDDLMDIVNRLGDVIGESDQP
jgi:hypothetical protein